MKRYLATIVALGLFTLAIPANAGSVHTLYYSQFNNLNGVTAWQSSPADNAKVKLGQTALPDLMHPTVKGNVVSSPDSSSSDGHSLVVWTRPNSFLVPGGKWYGETAGRAKIGPTIAVRPGLTITFRSRAWGDGKSAQMLWPDGPQNWELDFPERFDHSSGLSIRTHHGPKGQIILPLNISPYQWHIYMIQITKGALTYSIDGNRVATYTGEWVPTNPAKGYMSIGTAVPGPRSNTQTSNAIVWDWLKITQG